MNHSEQKIPKTRKKPGFWSLLVSTCAAAFGVQTRKNHERDFSSGDIKVFIIAGLLFTLVFIGIIYTLVRVVIATVA